MKQVSLNPFEKIFFTLLFALAVITLYIGFTNATYFNDVFAQEDGAIEYATFVFLFLISLLQFKRLFTLKNKNVLWKAAVFFSALLFFFGAGEEISWGQRIFNVESTDFFLDNNDQGETNLHNLKVGDVKLNKLIFSQLITLFMVVYLLIMPLLYNKFNSIKTFIDRLAIPVPKLSHIIAFLLNTAVILILPNLSRKWEVYELFFASIFLVIFLFPVNKEVYLDGTK